MDDYLSSDAAARRYMSNLADYAVVFLDLDGNVVRWNRGAALLKGYSFQEIAGTHFSRFYTPEARAVGHPERERAVSASVGRYEEEGWRVRKDNSRFWAHVIIDAIYDDDHVLRGFGKIVRDFTAHKQAVEQSANVMNLLEFTARTDYLTGLGNRRSFDQALNNAIATSRRYGRPLALAMIDLDRFKNFNDTFGHQAGDAYLKQASTAWRFTLRPQDLLARYGGEEFIVVLPETDLAAATRCLERLHAATPTPLTCSIGVAEWHAAELPDLLLGRADQACYKAKEAGRNQIVHASAPPVAPDSLLVQPSP